MNPLVLALDIGTSSARALAFDLAGRKVGDAAQIVYEQRATPGGGVEVDAPFLLDLCARCLDELLAALPPHAEVAGVGISCFWHSLLAVDPSGEPLTPVWSWADNRSAAHVEILRAALPESEFHARLGCVFHSSYWPAKFLWAREAQPELFAPGVRWMGFGEWLRLRWSGEARISLSMASGTGVFDQNRLDWDDAILDYLKLERAAFPALGDGPDFFALDAGHQTRWPALRNTKWLPAVGDGACSNIGSGCADVGRIGLNAGTSGALRVVLPDFQGAAPPGLWRYRVDARRSIVGGALSNAGNALVWARQTLQLPGDWPRQVAALAPDAHGLTILPFGAGERAPLWNGNARLCIEGATWNLAPVELFRALLESLALRYAAVARSLLELAPNAEIRFSGGALEAVPAWQTIVCDAIGAPLIAQPEPEASARGAAILALEALGLLEPTPEPAARQLLPDAGHHAVYVKALERQNGLYEKIYGRF